MSRTNPPSIEDHLDYRTFLREWFRWKKATQPHFSQRAFARRMGQKSPSVGVDIVAGRRRLTPKMVGPMAKALGLSAEERQFLGWLVSLERAKTIEAKNAAWAQISGHQRFREAHRVEGDGFRYLSDWTCPAIRELASRQDFRPDAAWIASQLRPQPSQRRVQESLDILLSLGLLVEQDGHVTQADAAVVTPPQVQGLAVHNYHHAMFGLAQSGIESFQPDERHYTGVTVCIPEALVPEIKRELQAFAERMLALCDGADGAPERVYQLHFAAFPLSASTKEPS